MKALATVVCERGANGIPLCHSGELERWGWRGWEGLRAGPRGLLPEIVTGNRMIHNLSRLGRGPREIGGRIFR